MADLFEVTLDDQPHTGAYGSRGEAERQLDALRRQFPGRKIEVRQRATGDGVGGGSRYQGDGSNDPAYVQNALQSQGAGAIQAGDGTIGGTQGLAQGILPGPGGVVNTGQIPPAPQPMIEGKTPTAAGADAAHTAEADAPKPDHGKSKAPHKL